MICKYGKISRAITIQIVMNVVKRNLDWSSRLPRELPVKGWLSLKSNKVDKRRSLFKDFQCAR